jgi:hypothetical protein
MSGFFLGEAVLKVKNSLSIRRVFDGAEQSKGLTNIH